MAKKALIDIAEEIARDIAAKYKTMEMDEYSKAQTTLDTLTKFLTLKQKIGEDGQYGKSFEGDAD